MVYGGLLVVRGRLVAVCGRLVVVSGRLVVVYARLWSFALVACLLITIKHYKTPL